MRWRRASTAAPFNSLRESEMSLEWSRASLVRRRGVVAAGILCTALASGAAMGQTAFGEATAIVFPNVASTATFTGHVTLYNPNAAAITVALDYHDANNLAVPGVKACNDVTIGANQSVEFTLADQCTLEPGSHFGLLIASDTAGTNLFFGYSRTENTAGAGFSIEGFPADSFSSDVSFATGLRQSAAAPTYQTNCFVASLGGPVTYDLQLFDGSTGAQIGTTLSGSLNAFEQFRYLDVFAAAAAPAGDYANVRAQFTRTSVDANKLIGFCTVQDSVSFGADFRIAKSQTPPLPPPVVPTISTAQWQGAISALNSNQVSYIFMGPTATATLNVAGTVTANGTGQFGTNGGTSAITVAVCYQDQAGPGPITTMGTPSNVTATSTVSTPFVSGSASLPAGTYSVGLCATNPNIGPVQKNGNTLGVLVVTQ